LPASMKVICLFVCLFVCAWFFHFFTYFAFQIQTSNQAFSFRKLDFQLSILYIYIFIYHFSHQTQQFWGLFFSQVSHPG
jgi:hypothetical protein